MKSQKNPFMVLAGEKGGVMTVKYSWSTFCGDDKTTILQDTRFCKFHLTWGKGFLLFQLTVDFLSYLKKEFLVEVTAHGYNLTQNTES
jgi:hypothetical protein